MIYDYQGNELVQKTSQINTIIAAHRGYHQDVAQNSEAALLAAADAGFRWVELDVRKTSDGVYILSHDNSVTLYDGGVATSVSISASDYERIRSFTWDSAGKYMLCTLSAAFNAMKTLDMWAIIDRKTGSNAEIIQIASMCGATDRVLLSYYTFAEAVSDMSLLAKYSWVPIRVYPDGANNAPTLIAGLKNPLYADINSTTVNNEVINNALAFGMPIIFSGCTKANYKVWSVLAKGVMANLDLNITPDEFAEFLKQSYNKVVTITPSSNSISVASGGNTTITAQSNDSEAAGYIYGYCLDPMVAAAKEITFGSSAEFAIYGKSAGSTILRLFTGTGTRVDIPVAVS